MKRLKRFLVNENPLMIALFGAVLMLTAPASAVTPNSPVNISDVPVFVDIKTLIPTNVLLLADDSGSMTWAHAPEGIGEVERACWLGQRTPFGTINPCPETDGYCLFAGSCGYPYPNPYPTPGVTSGYRDLGVSNEEVAARILPPPLMAAAFNKMAYNPDVTYTPPVYRDIFGVMRQFPDMGPGSWNAVGWPANVGGITRPQGVPVTINMAGVTSPPPTGFPSARTYPSALVLALQERYMRGVALPAQLTVTNPAPMPMHYYRTNVLWCPTLATTASPGVEGAFAGSAAYSAACTPERTEVNKYPYFHHTPGSREMAFTLVVLNFSGGGSVMGYGPASHLGTYLDENGVPQTRTTVQELTNYANWYAYYSNRTAATRTVASHALAGIDADRWLRMGVVTISGAASAFLDMEVRQSDPNKAGGKYDVYKELLQYGVAPTNRPTHLKTALHQVRNRFDTVGFDETNNRGFMRYSCQRNYVVALTDGLWNDDSFSMVGNRDRTIGTIPPRDPPRDPPVVFGQELKSGDGWPRPIFEGGLHIGNKEIPNTLSDVSLHAWLNELRATGTNAFGPESLDVEPTDGDPAYWRHLNTIALVYAVEGTLPNQDPQHTLARITAGTLDWPVPEKNKPTAIDDLWHATISGFGVFTTGVSADIFKSAIEPGHSGMAGLVDAGNRGGTHAELGLPLSRVFEKDPDDLYFGYSASFLPNYGGRIQKRSISLGVGTPVPGAVLAWDAEEKLAAKMSGTNYWNTGRKIFTGIEGTNTGVAFTRPALFGAFGATRLQNAFGTADASEQTAIVNYLRGDRSLEESHTGGRFRARTTFLGDFVHASPVVVDAPEFQYTLPGYEDFKNDPAHKDRRRMIYAAGNDGMLHAFEDKNPLGGESGEELWAFIPPDLLRSAEAKGIINLTRSRDDNWQHYFYVDATPRVIDVDINPNPNTDPDAYHWRTMLVGGLGKGGTSYYALDVTEADGARADQGEGMFRWSFTDQHMGYTYGRALMVRTNAWEGRWVVIVPSGLNNGTGGIAQAKPAGATGGDGRGRIYFLDPWTGAQLRDPLITPAGSETEPSGLAYIRAFTDHARTQLADAVYGGDQLGNFWRFDLTSDKPEEWKVVNLIELSNEANRPLPVNTEPRFEVSYSDDKKDRWIMIGTGRAYHESDLYDWIVREHPDTIQGMFVFKDGTLEAPEPDLTKFPYKRSDLQDIGATGVMSATGPQNGWVHFFDQGYQVVTNPDSLFERFAYVINRYVPVEETGGDLCTTAPFEAVLFVRDVTSGLRYPTPAIHFASGLASVRFMGLRADGRVHWGLVIADWHETQGTAWLDFPDMSEPVSGIGGDGTIRSSIRFINR